MKKQPNDIVEFPLPADQVKGCPPCYEVIGSDMIGRCCKCGAAVDYNKRQGRVSSSDPAHQSSIQGARERIKRLRKQKEA